MIQNLKSVLGKNNVGKGETAGCQHFLLSPKCLMMLIRQGCLKSVFCGKVLNYGLYFSVYLSEGGDIGALMKSSVSPFPLLFSKLV